MGIRGHDDSEGNLLQLLKLRCADDKDIEIWLRKGKYISPMVVNKQLKMMADSLLCSLLAEIRSSPWFAVQADEAIDVSIHEQMCVTIRWVTHKYEINKDPIGMIQLLKTDALTLSSVLKDVSIRCMLPLSSCKGQTYDGAANMSDHLHGVAARIKSEEPAGLHVHCLSHCLTLCLQDVTHTCTIVRNTLDW